MNIQNIICPACQTIEPYNTKFCHKCGFKFIYSETNSSEPTINFDSISQTTKDVLKNTYQKISNNTQKLYQNYQEKKINNQKFAP